MKKALLYCLFLFSAHLAASQNESFGRLPLLSDAKISPDGTRVAYLREINDKYYIVTQFLNNPDKPSQAAGTGDGQIRSYRWVNDTTILFEGSLPYYSKADYEKFTMWRVGFLDTDKNKVQLPFTSRKYRNNIGSPQLVSLLPDDPEHILLSYYYTGLSGNQLTEVFKVNVKDTDMSGVYRDQKSEDYFANTAGDIILYEHWHRKTDEYLWSWRASAEDEFQLVKDKDDEDHGYFGGSFIGIDETSNEVFYWARHKSSLLVLNKAKIVDGELLEKVTVGQPAKVDVEDVIIDPYTRAVIGYYYIDDYIESDYFDPTLRQIQADLKATFPDTGVSITSWSKDKSRLVVKISSYNSPLQYYLYDRNQGEIGLLGEGYPDIDKSLLSKVQNFTYQTSDDISIHSYVTIPSKWKKSKPMIVLPHGGPEARDSMEFDWMRQFYASNGYAVFQPNFRGSSGYGKDFAKLGYGQWGKDMQRDVNEGVAAVIEKFGVNKDKICIVGGSYGGYVAMYAAAKSDPLYQCAVSFAGISELSLIFLHEREQLQSSQYWTKSIGDKWEIDELKAYSPLDLATRNALPLLIVHGEDDTTVPPFQSEKMYKHLKKIKAKGMKYILLEDEDHWFSLGSSRKTFLEESLSFVEKHL